MNWSQAVYVYKSTRRPTYNQLPGFRWTCFCAKKAKTTPQRNWVGKSNSPCGPLTRSDDWSGKWCQDDIDLGAGPKCEPFLPPNLFFELLHICALPLVDVQNG